MLRPAWLYICSSGTPSVCDGRVVDYRPLRLQPASADGKFAGARRLLHPSTGPGAVECRLAGQGTGVYGIKVSRPDFVMTGAISFLPQKMSARFS